jgi:hypothetical protein
MMTQTMTSPRTITPDQLIPLADYAGQRKQRRQELIAVKKRRRMEVGPFATFHFENHATMLFQVQEMLFIEKGGEAQVADEIEAYAPLVPNGRELVATVMLEIEDPVRRAVTLSRLGGIEHTMFVRFAGETVKGVAEDDQERTNEAGKASSVHFVHFPFTDAQVAKFRAPGTEVIVGFSHPEYGHMAMMPEVVRAELASDFA